MIVWTPHGDVPVGIENAVIMENVRSGYKASKEIF